MFEREACVPLVVASRPRVGVGALSALRRLLTEVSGGRPMDASAAAAAGDSPDQNRGEVHATPPRPPPGDAGEPSSAIRPVRPASRGGRPGPRRSGGRCREGTRQALTGLLARLLLEHGANARRGGGRHER